MWCLHYPICMTRDWWPSVDARLMVIFRTGLWLHNFLYCLKWLPISWWRITASRSLTNYLIRQMKTLWGSVDAHFQNAEVNASLTLLLIKAATMLVMHNSKHIAFKSPYLHYQKVMMLCWRSVQGGSDIDTHHNANEGSQTSIMGKCRSSTLGLYKMQCPKLSRLCWGSVDSDF